MNSKTHLNSIKICNKWQIRKSLFRNDNKFFVKTYEISVPETELTLLLIPFDQVIEQSLYKMVSKLNSMKTEATHIKLLSPYKLKIETILMNKMFVLPILEKPINVDWLLEQKKYEFSALQIIESAISGLTSLSQLHSLGIVHGKISTSTLYFYNREQRSMSKTGNKSEVLTYFAVCPIDAQCFSVRGLCSKNKIRDIIYEPCCVGLGLKPTFKDDIESLLYVLFKMATKNLIFSSSRYEQQWKSEQQVRKWKLNELYLQILQHIPQSLSVLIQFYLHLQQAILSEKIDYSYYMKRLWKQKQGINSNTLKQKQLIQIKIPEQITSEINLNFENSQLFGKREEQNNSEDEIFEEQTNIGSRFEKVVIGKSNFQNLFDIL